MSYYILDPKDGRYAQPKPVHNEDPHSCTKKVDHWEFWLYRRGSPLNGIAANRWGMIYDQTLEQARRELEQGQQFEIAYAKFFHKPEDSEPNTYFNPFGPIACLGSCYPNGVADQLERFMKGLTVGQALFGAIVGMMTNKGLGGMTRGLIDSYGNALQDGLRKSKELSDALLPGLSANINTIGDVIGSITDIDQKRQKIIHRLDAVDSSGDYVRDTLPSVWYCQNGHTILGERYTDICETKIDRETDCLIICERHYEVGRPSEPAETVTSVEVDNICGVDQFTDTGLMCDPTIAVKLDLKKCVEVTKCYDGIIKKRKERSVVTHVQNQDAVNSLVSVIDSMKANHNRTCAVKEVIAQVKAVTVKHDILNPNVPGVAVLNSSGFRSTITRTTGQQASLSTMTNRFSGLHLNTNSTFRPAMFNYAQYPKTVNPDGDSYQGQKVGNTYAGYGKYVFKDGRTYEGQWRNGLRHGQGKFNYNNGQIYEGEFVDDQFQGHGKVIFADGRVYEGQWLNSQFEGRGKMTYKNGDFYEGEWKNDQRYGHGEGKTTFDNGNVYEGQWLNNKLQGQGKYIWPSGEVYEGQWQNDQRHGRGKNKYADGNIYEGQWQNGVRQGQGKFVWRSGQVYEGEWQDGKRHGYGKDKDSDGKVYEGEWQDDKRQGQGKFTWSNGEVYEGQFLNGQRQGSGQMRYLDGRICKGTWVKDQMQEMPAVILTRTSKDPISAQTAKPEIPSTSANHNSISGSSSVSQRIAAYNAMISKK